MIHPHLLSAYSSAIRAKSPRFCSVVDMAAGSVRYNSKIDGNTAIYEVALPGYAKEEVEVKLVADYLEISSNSRSEEYGSYQVVGAGKSPFKARFYVGEGATVSRATMADGLLKIRVDRTPPSDSVSVPIT